MPRAVSTHSSLFKAVPLYGDAESVRQRRPRPPIMEIPKNKFLSLSLSAPRVPVRDLHPVVSIAHKRGTWRGGRGGGVGGSVGVLRARRCHLRAGFQH